MPTIRRPRAPGDTSGVIIPASGELTPAEVFGDEREEQTPADRLVEMLTDASGDDRAYVNVSKRTPAGTFQYCAKFTPVEFEAGGYDMIRDKWGGGSYEIRLYGMMDSGKFGVRARPIVDIAAPLTAPATQTVQAAQTDPALASILGMLAEGQTAMARAITELRASIAAPPVDQFAQFERFATLFKTLQPAPAPAAPANSLSDTIAVLRELKGAAQEFAPAHEGEESLITLAKPLMEMLADARKANPPAPPAFPAVSLPPGFAAEPAPVAQAAPVSHPAPAIAPATAPAPIHYAPESMNELQRLQALLNTFAAMADQKADVQTAAEFLDANLPDDLAEVLDSPDWFEQLSQVLPRAAENRAWLEQVRAVALPLIFTDEPDPGTTASAPQLPPAG